MSEPLRVLIVEDSKDDAALLVRELRRGGYDPEFTLVDTPKDFSAELERGSWKIIIADYSMPRFSGLEALELLKKSGIDLPFILVSGTIGEDVAVAAMKAGAHDYIIKGSWSRLVPAIKRELSDAEIRKQRRQAESALKESEERFHFHIENLDLIAVGLDNEGNITYVNRALCKLFGLSSEELVGQSWVKNFIPKKDRPDIHNVHQDQILAGSYAKYENPILLPSGDVRLIKWNNTTFKNKHGNTYGTMSIGEDITERKRAEEALRRNEETLRLTLDATSDGSWNWNIKTGEVLYSDKWVKNLGYTRDEVEPHVSFWESIVHPDDIQNTQEKLKAHFEGRTEYYQCENRLRMESGVYHWNKGRGRVVERGADGQPLRMVGTGANIDDRKMAEAALRDSEEKFSNAFKFTPDSITITTLKDGKYIEVNQGFERIFGYKSEEAVGKTSTELNIWVNPADRDMLVSLLQKQGYVRDKELEIRVKSGETRTCLFSAEIININDVPCSVATTRDITEQKMAVKELKQFRETLDQTLDCVFMFDAKTLKFIYVNQGSVELVGYSREELMNMTPVDIKPEYTEESFREMVAPLLDSSKDSHHFETVHKHKDGHLIPVEISLQCVAPPGEPGRFVAIVQNITERKQAEHDLKVAHQRTSAILNTVGEGIIAVGTDSRIHYVNQELLHIFGYSLEEIIGVHITKLMPEKYRAAHSAGMKRYLENTTPIIVDRRMEMEGLHKDGAVFPIEIKIEDTEIDGKNRIFTAAIRDITERKRAEEELNKTNRMLRMISNCNETLIHSKSERELLDDMCKGIITDDDDYCMAWIGYADHDGGKPVRPMAQAGYEEGYLETLNITWADTERGQGPTGTSIRTRKPVIAQDIHTDPRFKPWRREAEKRGYASSAAIPLVINSEAIGALNIYSAKPNGFDKQEMSLLMELAGDVSYGIASLRAAEKQKKTEKEVSRLHTAIEQAEETVVITDTDGTIQYVNPAFERITGYKADAVIGQNPNILKSGKHDESFYTEMWETITGGEAWVGHFINKKKNGELFEEEATISPIKDPSSTIIGYVAVKRDVTREVMLERQFRQAQKMEAMGTLAGGIAHDFNNILFAMLGYSSLVVDYLPEGSDARENLDEVIKAGARAKDLVRQILAFSHQTEQEFQPIQLHLIVKEVLKLMKVSIPPSIVIRQNVNMKFDTVMADPSQIHQVVMNLATNASHAMQHSGGVLEVSLTAVDVDIDLAETNAKLREGPYVLLSVSDTGHGMNKATIERIFEPFFTTKDVGEGTGMGLAAVHGIVGAHGGAITVESKIGKGATFNIYLPRVESAVSVEPSAEPSVPHGNEKILVVDDEVSIVRLMEQMLKRLGYDAVAFSSSGDALESFLEDSDKFDLVITDQSMPGMMGEALARAIHKVRPNTPIIMMTGFAKTVSLEKVKTIGVRELLLKPIIPNDLGRTVRRVLDQTEMEV